MPNQPPIECTILQSGCQTRAIYHLVTGCADKHITINTPCFTCLHTLMTWHHDKKLWCETCQYPILSGQYQLINTTNLPAIKTFNLTGTLLRETPNPQYTPHTYPRNQQ